MPAPETIRMDKWLWAARIFKTRSSAAEACHQGHVKIAGQPVKASRNVHVNEIIVVLKDHMTRTFKVLQPLQHRVGAHLVKDHVEDLTPPAEWERARQVRQAPVFARPKGTGRPTKKDRRSLSDILESF